MLDAADAAYEAHLAKCAQKNADLLGEKAALEERLKELRSARKDFEDFNDAVHGCERIIERIFSDPDYRERPFLAVFNIDPLKWSLKRVAAERIVGVFRYLAVRELALIHKWQKAYLKARHTHIYRFASGCGSKAEAIRRLNCLYYDVESDVAICEKRLASIIRQLEAPSKAQARAEKKRREKARREALLNRQRSGAQGIRLRLPRDHPCPYCGGPLGSAPHADHIHPVGKGGLSTIENMVNICAQCNSRKSHMTLTAFVAKEGRDLAGILARLRALGKEF